MIASGWMISRRARNSELLLILSGCTMGSPHSSAARLTREAASSMPRPLARSGWVTTSLTLNPVSTNFSSVGTANIGVPQNTRSITAALPFTQFNELADLALHQVAFERQASAATFATIHAPKGELQHK